MLGFDRKDLLSGRISWRDLTPPEWDSRVEQALSALKATGTAQPIEKEYFRKGGSRMPVLVEAAALDERNDQTVLSFSI